MLGLCHERIDELVQNQKGRVNCRTSVAEYRVVHVNV